MASSPQQREKAHEMPLARCETCGCPQGLKHTYTTFHVSVGLRLLCGAPTCTRLACIWLTDEEQLQYLSGQRSFRLPRPRLDVLVE